MKGLIIVVLLACGSTPAFAGDVLAKTTLVRGAIISASDVMAQPGDGENAHTVLTAYVGKEVKRTIYPGQKINPKFIGSPILVKRNSRVTMIYRSGPLEISAFGRALGEGGAGDVVTVMNLDSRKRVNGVVNAQGNVEVTL